MRAHPFRSCGILFLTVAILPAQSCPVQLQTVFAADNGGAVGGAVYFDLTVLSPVSINALQVNTSVAAGLPIGLTVFSRGAGTTWLGNHTASDWTQIGIDDGTAVSAGAQRGSRVPLLAPLALAPGTYAVALVGSGRGGSLDHRYTNNGHPVADAHLGLDVGGASNVPFAGGAFLPRLWNGVIEYTSADALVAGFATSGATCGMPPLAVAFHDRSCTTDPGGIVSWQWDFGDGTTASVPDPVHVYTRAGVFSPSLVVTDAIHGPASAGELDLVCTIDNDECAAAVPVYRGTFGPFCNACATTSTPPWTCAGVTSDVWFRFVAQHDGDHEVDTCAVTEFDTALEVLDGTCGALRSLACNDDACGRQSSVRWSATAGTPYFIRVGGHGGETGRFFLQVRVVGSVTSVVPGCCGTTLQVRALPAGQPELGGTLTFTLAPSGGWMQQIWLGNVTAPVPLCPACTLGCDLTVPLPPGGRAVVAVPVDPTLCGAGLGAQGSILLVPGGCNLGGLTFTVSDALAIRLGCD